MTDRYDLRRGVIHRAYAEAIYPSIEPGSVRLVVSDGAYGMFKADWDRVKLDDLPAWYAPHVEAWGRLCAPSASVYLWNTAAGWARLDPVMRAAGWRFRALVTWDKGLGFLAGKCDVEGCRTWPDVTEVCGFYQRNEWEIGTCAGSMIGEAAGTDERNPGTEFFIAEREAAQMSRRDLAAYFPSKTGRITGCVANWEIGYNFPTWEVWKCSAAAMQEQGPPRDRPYLVHPAVWPDGDLRASYDHLRAEYDHLRAEYDHLRAEYDHLRAEYERARVPFTLPPGITNVWTHPQVGGMERLRAPDGKALHPCQKPLTFSDRMIRASTRPGDLVLEAFGGTCRVAVACERMPEPDARRYICIEPDEDGRDYIAAVLPSLRLELPDEGPDGQVGLFSRDTPGGRKP